MNLSKRQIIIILAAAVIIILFGSCTSRIGNKNKEPEVKNYSATQLAEAVAQKTGFTKADILQNEENFEADFEEFFGGLKAEKLSTYASLQAEKGIDEISVLVAADSSDTSKLKRALKSRLRDLKDAYGDDYADELKGAEVFAFDDTAVLIVTKDADKLVKNFKELSKKPDSVAELSAKYEEASAKAAFIKNYDYTKPVPESEAADKEWFKDAMFIGDSRMAGIMYAADYEYGANFSSEGLSVADIFTKRAIKIGGGTYTVGDALQQEGSYTKCYIMMGVNELGWYSTDTFIEFYGDLIDAVRESHPEAQVYVMSLLPVGYKALSTSEWLNNDRVNMYNGLLQDMCAEKNAFFVYAYDSVAQNGVLPDDAAPDGVHLIPEYCNKVSEYLLTHTVQA